MSVRTVELLLTWVNLLAAVAMNWFLRRFIARTKERSSLMTMAEMERRITILRRCRWITVYSCTVALTLLVCWVWACLKPFLAR